MEKKLTAGIVLLFIIALILGIWTFELKGTINYEREAYAVSLLNYEANEFCIKVAQAYYSGDEDKIKEYYVENEAIENLDSLKDLELAVIGFKQLNYIANSERLEATYEIQYRVLSEFTEEVKNELSIDPLDKSIRQMILVVKNIETNEWAFMSVDYR
ncbi:MAG: hypothetical protein CVV02_05795 [Firmicutes bacterium HGW-Firmicutes-7]|nr:MAG: hypothetical protein CVV02_05795 [Firmicutes bacterium HGW-Firmicutes-7]